jgi:hypothetical protein
MLGDMIATKAGKVASDRDLQAIRILLLQAAARVVQMIENTKAYRRLAITFHDPLRLLLQRWGRLFPNRSSLRGEHLDFWKRGDRTPRSQLKSTLEFSNRT